MQCFDLDLEKLPELDKLEPLFEQWEQRTTTKQVVPSYLWVRNLRLVDVPKLNVMDWYVANTESIEIKSRID